MGSLPGATTLKKISLTSQETTCLYILKDSWGLVEPHPPSVGAQEQLTVNHQEEEGPMSPFPLHERMLTGPAVCWSPTAAQISRRKQSCCAWRTVPPCSSPSSESNIPFSLSSRYPLSLQVQCYQSECVQRYFPQTGQSRWEINPIYSIFLRVQGAEICGTASFPETLLRDMSQNTDKRYPYLPRRVKKKQKDLRDTYQS